MAEMLKFKKGLYNALPEAKTAGTIYVTTDEKAMYVDVDNNTRIRLGEIIQYDSYEKFKEAKPPFNEEAFYYLIDDNALLKYRGVDEESGNHKWQQVNTVSDVQAAVGELESRIEDAESNIAGLQESVENITKANGLIAAAESRAISTASADATAKANQAKADAISDADSKLANKVDTSTYNEKIGEIETNITNITKADGLIAAAESRAATDATTKANSAKEAAITSANEYTDSKVSDLSNTVDNKVDKSAYDAKVVELTNAITKAQTDAEKNAADDATTKANNALAQAKTYTNDEIVKVNTEISKKVDQSAYNAKVEELEGDITNAISTASADATSKANQAKVDAVTDANKYTDSKISDLSKTVGNKADKSALEQAITDLEKYADDAETAANKYTDGKVAQALAEADAMTFRGIVSLSKALPTSGVQCGDTYKVAEKGVYGGYECYVGDLLIASADQGEETDYAGGWDHISSGYEDDYDPTLSVNNNKVFLRNTIGDERGSVTFVAKDESVNVVVTGEADPTTGIANTTVTVGIEWGSF